MKLAPPRRARWFRTPDEHSARFTVVFTNNAFTPRFAASAGLIASLSMRRHGRSRDNSGITEDDPRENPDGALKATCGSEVSGPVRDTPAALARISGTP